jgi:hypothetical protein
MLTTKGLEAARQRRHPNIKQEEEERIMSSCLCSTKERERLVVVGDTSSVIDMCTAESDTDK